MSDFNKPVISDAYATVLSTIRSLFAIVAKQDYTGASNIPTGAKRLNETTKKLEKYNGSGWEEALAGHFVGAIILDAGATPPDGFLACDGTAVDRTTYAALFTRIGETYGAGDGSTTFNLPNMKGRFPLGKADSGTGNTLGSSGGSLDHVHSVAGHYHSKGNLYINSSGSHTTSISHDHGAVTSSSDTHSHTFSGTTGATSTDQLPGRANSSPGNNTKVMRSNSSGSNNNTFDTFFNHTHSFSGTTATDAHSHSVDLPSYSANSASSGAHTHANGYFAGNVGNISGANGDNAQDTSANNPAFLTLNYVIKY